MQGNNHSPTTDRTGRIVIAGMLLLALMGIATVFGEPIRALVAPAGQPAAVEANR